MANRILVAEISGKRPGNRSARPTEKFRFDFDKVIISNNSDGYETDWPIVMVPDDYQEWYRANAKMNDIAYYAPMNRSYAIKYAKEHGYDYLIQLDDNISTVSIRYHIDNREYSTLAKTPHIDDLPSDMVSYLVEVLEHTDAGISGMQVIGASMPTKQFLAERYAYSFFALKLSVIPEYYQGDFEDDIEFRLKLKQKNIPSIIVCPFEYRKTSQNSGSGDVTGNRKAYVEAGVKRGEHMSKLYGDYYSAGISSRGSYTTNTGKPGFRHKLKPFKVGVRLNYLDELKSDMADLFSKYATPRPDQLKLTVTKS